VTIPLGDSATLPGELLLLSLRIGVRSEVTASQSPHAMIVMGISRETRKLK